MEITHHTKGTLLLEQTSSENGVTYFKRDVLSEVGDFSKNISIVEFFASDKKALFNCQKASQCFYIIVGEISFETDNGEEHVASRGDIVQIPCENTYIKIFTNKYGKALQIQ